MNCPCCARDNGPARRYCGGCGTNIEPACRACGFMNEARDRFCGGCGAGLAQAQLQIASAPVVVSKPAIGGELDGLFASIAVPVAAPKLPENKISQDDIDNLFGGAS